VIDLLRLLPLYVGEQSIHALARVSRDVTPLNGERDHASEDR
jgi:hypothetical protein